MNLYSFLRKKHSKPFIGAIFAAVFLSAFFALKLPAEAALSDYKNLFSGVNKLKDNSVQAGPSLKLIQLYTQGTSTVDAQFQFIGAFPFSVTENPTNPLRGKEKAWYWNHIRDFEDTGGSKYVFMLRVCDVNATGESGCVYSIVPHKSETADDQSSFCPGSGATCTMPGPGSPWPKIYHYTAEADTQTGLGLIHSDIQNDHFNIQFGVSGLSLLGTTPGTLDTPIPASTLFKVGEKTTYKADIWYCAGKISGEDLPAVDDSATPNIRQFNNICEDNRPYFKIAETGPFTPAQTAEEAAGQTPGSVDQVDTTPSDSDSNSTLPVCHILNGAGPGEGTFMGCIAQLGYYLFYMPLAWIAGILGRVMDFFLGYSISDESYRATVVVTGWKLVRDISNIFFIIILVYTGLATVFKIDSVSMKKVVPALIINALIINFSLFGTRLVIDISNITSRLFYNTMSVCDGKCIYKDPPHEKEIANPNTRTTGGYKPLSEKIVDSFDPQTIFQPGTLSSTAPTDENTTDVDQSAGGFNASGVSNNIESSRTLGIYDSDYAGYFLIVSLIAAIIMLGMAKMFFGVMFMFVGRVVGLYLTMIFAPFAVLTRGNMPIVGKIKNLSWNDWLKELTNYALLAPIFIFFLYIIYAFINSDMLTIFKLDSGGFMNTVISVAIPMIIVYMLVNTGVQIAKDYAGKAGNMVQGFASKATGFVAGAAVGVASGGLALAGTRVAGAVKLSEEKRTELIARRAEGGLSGRLASMRLNLNDKAQSGSFDVRKTKAFGSFGSLAGNIGISLNDKVSGAVGLGQDATKGGIKAIEKKEKGEVKEKIESIKTDLSNDGAKKYWEKRLENQALKNYETELLKSGMTAKEIKAMKNKDGTLKDEHKGEKYQEYLKAVKDESKEKFGDVATNKQLTQALRQEFAQTLADGNTFGQQLTAPLAVAGGAAVVGTAPGVVGAALTTPAAAPVLMTVAYERNRKRRVEKSEAESYIKKAKESRKNHSTTKEERLEARKKELEDKLKETEDYIESIDSDLKENFKKIIAEAEAGNVMFKKFKGRTAESFGDKPGDLEAVTDMHKDTIRENINDHNDEIAKLRAQMKEEKDHGYAAEAAETDKKIKAKIASKKVEEWKLEQLDEKRKQNLATELNKKEDELDKIKEKADKAKESGK